MAQLTDSQNETMLELFDGVHNVMHMLRAMAENMDESAAELEQSLLNAVRCLDPDPPNMDNVVLFPTGKVFDEET
tara:strand:- start:15856 stop:16080 length:225 start_codon:yes stop_codon:yes gene_type:complete